MFETAMFLEGMEKLVSRCHENSKSKGFWSGGGDNESIPAKLALIHSEVSEWLESYRKGNPECEKPIDIIDPKHRSESDPIGHRRITSSEEEAADIMIRLCDLCGKLGIDLGAVTLAKMAYNANRPHMHRKKC